MTKTEISVVTIGHMPGEFNRQKIKNWNSSLFKVVGYIESYSLPVDSDGEGWAYTDDNLKRQVLEKFNGNFLIALVNVPIEDNWYSRRLGENRIVITFHEIKNILSNSNIP